jgi:DNA repair exonuclease SbcCD ATPase subunit
MLAEIARELRCQLIIITHDQELAALAETAYQVNHNGVESEIILLKSQEAVRLKRRVKK